MIKNVYICSAGHSGSTLLDMLIGSHSKVESMGEITHLPKNIALNTPCGCGDPVKECDFWKDSLVELEKRTNINMLTDPYAFDLGYIAAKVVVDKNYQTRFYDFSRKISHALLYAFYRYGIPLHFLVVKRFKQSILNNVELYQSVRMANGADLIVDSSKSYLKGLGVYLHNKEETRIVVLVRDGRGVFYSNVKRGFEQKKSLTNWMNYYKRALSLLDKYVDSKHMLFVKYEDLANDTKNVMMGISKFLNIEFENNMLDFSSKTHHITNGNNTRFISTSIKLDEAWRDKLTDPDISYFNDRASYLNKRLGYE